MKTNVKRAGAAVGAMVLAGGMVAIPAMATEPAAVETAADVEAVAGENAEAQAVEGELAYTQEALTGMETFAKAASAVCASMPDYAADCAGMEMTVSSGDAELVATVQQLAEEDATTHIIGCACSSNIAGGGAVGNAEVGGVTLESVTAAVNAL